MTFLTIAIVGCAIAAALVAQASIRSSRIPPRQPALNGRRARG